MNTLELIAEAEVVGDVAFAAELVRVGKVLDVEFEYDVVGRPVVHAGFEDFVFAEPAIIVIELTVTCIDAQFTVVVAEAPAVGGLNEESFLLFGVGCDVAVEVPAGVQCLELKIVPVVDQCAVLSSPE